ncbi:MAG: hypothetical protein HY926_06380 [Elusimicrobia bacterium]|nr:hypothetical protein [Elusimicrobiota bacterium]
MMRSILFAIILSAAAPPARAASPDCQARLADYLAAHREGRQTILDQVAQDDRLGASCLKKFLRQTAVGRPLEDYEAVLSALASLETDAAARVLYKEVSAPKKWHPRMPAKHLAAMGRRALPLLVKLSKKRKFSLSRSADDLPVHPHFYAPPEAAAATEAVALISDSEAAPGLLALAASDTRLAVPAMRALARMRAGGAEERALLLWSEEFGDPERKAAALGYLLSMSRERYLPLLKRALSDFSAEVQRSQETQSPLPDEMRSLLAQVLYLGGDPAAAGPFAEFLRSKTWRPVPPLRTAREEGALAILALGLTHDPAAREPLLELLKDESQFAPLGAFEGFFYTEHPSWPRFLSYGTSEKTKSAPVLPASVVAAAALGELGDGSTIAAIEEASQREPYLKKVYDEQIARLRAASTAPAAATPVPPEPRP